MMDDAGRATKMMMRQNEDASYRRAGDNEKETRRSRALGKAPQPAARPHVELMIPMGLREKRKRCDLPLQPRCTRKSPGERFCCCFACTCARGLALGVAR